MAFLQKVFTSFHNYANGNTRIGELNRIWYDSNSNTFRIQLDKVTPGGTIIGGGGGGGLTTATVNTIIANSLTNYATQTWVTNQNYITSSSLSVTTLASGTNALTYNNGVFTFTPSNLSSYATQTWVTNQNYITSSSLSVTTLASGTNALTYSISTGVFSFTPSDLSSYATQTWVTNQNYIQNETGVRSIAPTPNQTTVTDLGNRDFRIGTVQDIGTTSTVIFGDLTVNNISILGTSTNLISNVVQGYRLYLASSATNISEINNGGVVLGSTATGQYSLLWNYNNGNDYWYTDPTTGFRTEHLDATTSTLQQLYVEGTANIGYSNLGLTYTNALLQIDAAAPSYAQVILQNHSSSTYASGDFVITNDIGNDGKNFIDMGINSSCWSTSSWVINGANDGYLYIDSGNLAIGTTASNIKFFVGPADTTDSIVATIDSTGLNVDSIKPLTPNGDIVLISTVTNATGTVYVPSLTVGGLGSMLSSQLLIEAYITSYTLVGVVDYSTTDALPIGQYGNINGVAAPWTVFQLSPGVSGTPVSTIAINDKLTGAGIIPSIVRDRGLGGPGGGDTSTWNSYVIVDLDLSQLGQVQPIPGALFGLTRPLQKAGFDISTQFNTDIFLNSRGLGDVIVNTNILPVATNINNLGSPEQRWKAIYLGPGTIYVLDETLGSDIAIGARDGLLYVQNGKGLQVGEFTFIENQIRIANPARDIIIGITTATGNVIFNRPIKVDTPGGGTSFSVDRLGLTTIHPPVSMSNTQSALNIIGNTSGIQQPRNFSDTMLQITGADNTSTRVSMDSFGTNMYPVIAGRQAGGTVSAPSRTVKDDTLFRISTQGWGDTGYVSTIGRIQVQALQDFTDTVAGTRVRFQLTPINTTTIQTVTADITATGLSFVGNPIGGVTFRDSTFQYTAFTSTNAVTRVFAGTGTAVSTSTGAVTVWNTYAYTLNTATSSVLGGVKIGSNVNITSDGTISVTPFNTSTLVAISVYAQTFNTSTLVANSVNAQTANTATNAAYAYSFNTSTLVSNAVTSQNVVGGVGVYTLTAGTGTAVSANSGTVTVWNTVPAYTLPTASTSTLGGVKVDGTSITINSGVISAEPTTIDSFSSTVTTQASTLSVDMTTGPSVIFWQPSANGNRAITLSNFTAGRRVKIFITPHRAQDTFTFTGVTASQCSNGSITYTLGGGGVAQSSMMIEIFSTTTAIGGVWIFGYGSQ